MANKKIQLHTPSGQLPAYDVFPLTVLGAIYGGPLANAGDEEYKIAPDGQIIEPYLVIMGETGVTDPDEFATADYYVKPRYLPMLDVQNIEISGSTFQKYVIDHEYLDILDENGKIDTQYLPSYVDDVVNVTVFSGDTFPSTGEICIHIETNQQGGTVYKFYKRTGDSWSLGGGETSKIYMDPNSTDYAIYRCVSGDPTTAVKISENPFVIDTTKTNGVYLSQDGSSIKAMADVATRQRFGTVKVTDNTNPVNGVYMIVSDGVIAVGANLATGISPGTVITAGSTAAVASLIEAGYSNSNIVPTAQFMTGYVDSAVSSITPVVDHASTEDYGVVRISPTGNISVSDGVISVPAAGSTVRGVTYIVDTIDGTAGNGTKAVTLSGITTYVGTTLSSYQPKLSAGDGIDITSNTISVKTLGAVTISSGAVTVPNATDVAGGVVAITDASTDIAAEKSQITGGVPLAVTPNAVKDYVDGAVAGILVPATADTAGVVYIKSIANATSSDADNTVPKAWDVKQYVDSHTTTPIVAGVGLSKTIDTSSETFDVVYGGAITTSSISGKTAIVVLPATSNATGAVQIGSGIDVDANGVISVDKGVTDSAGYVTTSNGSQGAGGSVVPLGGVRVYSSGGIQVENGVLSLKTPTSSTLGGVMLYGPNAITLDTNSRLALATEAPLHISGSKLNISSATTSTSGAVTILTDYTAMNNSAAVPVGSAVNAYVSNTISGTGGVKDWVSSNYQPKLTNGVGIDATDLANNSVTVNFESPIVSNGSAIKVQTASGGSTTTLLDTALGAVWVRTEIRSSAIISEDTKAQSTVPTEQAVRTLVDGLHYLDYTIVD